MKRKVSTKGLIVVALWVFGAIVLIAFLMQVRSYAGVINDSGVVRGGTQRVVKMELKMSVPRKPKRAFQRCLRISSAKRMRAPSKARKPAITCSASKRSSANGV